MELKDFSAFPGLNLILYYNRAIDDKHWLEAIVLAHMYIETQLRTILGKEIRKAKNTKKAENVIGLAVRAREKKKIEEGLSKRIEEFNITRNNAVHNLAVGIVTYDQLESTARQAGSLIQELQMHYAYKAFEPE